MKVLALGIDLQTKIASRPGVELSAVLSNVNFASAALAKVLLFGLFDL